MKTVIALMCNKEQINRAYRTIIQIRTKGEYNGDIVLFFDEDILSEMDTLNNIKSLLNVILKQLPKIDNTIMLEVLNRIKTPTAYPNAKEKIFILHKFNVCHVYFKQWDKLLYIDAGMHIYNKIDRILQLDCKDSFMAHSNCYPSNYFRWNLRHQFDLINEPEIVKRLYDNFDMSIKDNFQATMMMFDTNIILEDTLPKLIELSNEYPISVAVDQGTFNLYFLCIRNLWKPIPIMDKEGFLYDFSERYDYKYNEYVMLKYPRTDTT